MNVFGIGTGELLLILLIALLVLGPERLPEIARMLGKFMRIVRQFSAVWYNFNAQLNAEISRELDVNTSPKTSPPSPPIVETDETSNTIAPPQLTERSSLTPVTEDTDEAAHERV